MLRRSAVWSVSVLCCVASVVVSMTPIKVTNTWNKEVNVKIHGEGIGGCDVLLDKNQTDP